MKISLIKILFYIKNQSFEIFWIKSLQKLLRIVKIWILVQFKQIFVYLSKIFTVLYIYQILSQVFQLLILFEIVKGNYRDSVV